MYDRQLEITATQWISEHCFVLEFDAPDVAAECRPGQFLMLGVNAGIDPLLRRPMAVYQVLREGDRAVGFSVLVERTGRGTTLLADLAVGDRIPVLGPLGGEFRPPPAGTEAMLVMGGVGSAPFPLFAQALQELGRPARALIGGRTAGHLLCAADFEALGVPVHVATEDGSAGHHGLVTAVLDEQLEQAAGPVALYSCGPTPMMRAVDAIARTRGVPHQVSLEAPMACGIGVCLSCVVPVRLDDETWKYARICREGPVFDAEQILWEHPDA